MLKRTTLHHLASCVFVVLAAHAAGASSDGRESPVSGTVTDPSGALLPGVTVSATTPSGATVDASTTDEHGTFLLPHVAGSNLTLTFALDGFSTKSVRLTVNPGVESRVSEVLTLAPRTETVMVIGTVPAEPARLTSMPAPEPLPPLSAVPAHDRDSVCGPAMPSGDTEFGHIRAIRDDAKRQLYTQGDVLLIDGGTDRGLEVGHNYVARRTYRVRGTARDLSLEHSAGVVQVVSADEQTATAVVVYACDVLMKGDALAAFLPEPTRTPEPFGTPAFDDAARIVVADSGQQLGAPRRLMVIDRGADADLHVGQTLTLFRREGVSRLSASVVGAAVIVALREHSATIRVDQGRDAIDAGDFAAPQRYAPQSSSAAGVIDER
ncbi:MAG: carboxypeptidase-like regulatory domain-containing protein [Vicinamibacterales bacterium]